MTRKFASVLALVVGAAALSVTTAIPASAATGDVVVRTLSGNPETFTNPADGSCHALKVQGHDVKITNNTNKGIRVHSSRDCKDTLGNGIAVAKGQTKTFPTGNLQSAGSFKVESS